MTRPLNKREQKKLIRKANEAKYKRTSKVINWLFLLSVIPFLYSYVQYAWVIVDIKIPVGIFISTGLVFGIGFKKYYENKFIVFNFKLHLFWSIFSMGAIFTSFFFLTNNLFSKHEVYSIKTSIVDTYVTRSRRGGKSVIAEVRLDHFTKDLHFPIEDEEKIDSSNFILLNVSKGGLGFEIIRDKTLVND